MRPTSEKASPGCFLMRVAMNMPSLFGNVLGVSNSLSSFVSNLGPSMYLPTSSQRLTSGNYFAASRALTVSPSFLYDMFAPFETRILIDARRPAAQEPMRGVPWSPPSSSTYAPAPSNILTRSYCKRKPVEQAV